MFVVEIHDDPDGFGGKVLVTESFNVDPQGQEHCVTIVATMDGARGEPVDLDTYANVHDWAAYMAAFGPHTSKEARLLHCRTRGNKVMPEVAVAIFTRLPARRFRR